MSGRKRKIALIGALTSLVVIAAASFASAAVVTKKYHGGKVVVACYKTDTGAMRVVNNKNKCKSNETVLRWYRSGSAGPAGKAGAAGKPGAAGASLLSGTVPPSGTDGKNGDFWFDSVAGKLYGPKAGAWPAGTTLKGLQGDDGPIGPMGMPGNGLPGTPGAAGANGNTILSGIVAPISTDGVNGDFFLDTATSTLYGPKAAGSWTGTDVALKGADGVAGAEGNDGGAGPQGIQGIQGPQGAQGPQGPAGNDGAGGAGTILTASSGANPGTMTTIAGGLVGTVTAMPLSGAYSEDGVNIVGGLIDTTLSGVPQVFSRNGTITAISLRAITSLPLSLIGTTVTLEAQLYTSPGGSSTMAPVPGASCTSTISGILAIGTRTGCWSSEMSFPVTADSTAMVVVTATATGLGLVNSVSARLTTSLTVS